MINKTECVVVLAVLASASLPGQTPSGALESPRPALWSVGWIGIGRKNAPDAIESKFDVTSQAFGRISVVSLTSPAVSGPAFARYFFQVGKTPLLLEAGYRVQDPKKEEYLAAVRWMIERAAPIR